MVCNSSAMSVRIRPELAYSLSTMGRELARTATEILYVRLILYGITSLFRPIVNTARSEMDERSRNQLMSILRGLGQWSDNHPALITDLSTVVLSETSAKRGWRDCGVSRVNAGRDWLTLRSSAHQPWSGSACNLLSWIDSATRSLAVE